MKQTALTLIIAAVLVMTARADVLTIHSQPNSIEDGGQFSSTLSSDPSQDLLVYCVDARNFITVPDTFAVNVVDLANLSQVTADTRYGQTAPADFSFGTGTAQQRYAMAAWLTEQYNFSGGVTKLDDEIQNTIWTLLDVNGAVFADNGGVGTYLALAQAWLASQSTAQLALFESHVEIFSSTNIAGTSGATRYSTGQQEQVYVDPTATPEITSWLMMSAGLGFFGFVRRRKSA